MKRFGMSGILSFMLISLVILASCDINNSNNTNNGSPLKAHLKIKITDAPFPLDTIANANITIEKITLHKADMDTSIMSENNGDSTRGSFITVFEGEKETNLMDLQNGITEDLADIDVDPGTYDQVRVYISMAMIELNGGATYDLKIPSASTSGLKIFIMPALQLDGGTSGELLIDFDLSRSLIPKGNTKHFQGFNFKPVIRAVNNSNVSTGDIEGIITDSADVALENASVWIEIADTTYSETQTEETGYYAFIGVPEGIFTWHAAKENYDSLQIDSVEVVAGTTNTVDAKLAESE